MYAGDQPHFCPAKKKTMLTKVTKSLTNNDIKNFGDIRTDIFRVPDVLSLKCSPPENDVLMLVVF